jgi:hypothetical protein
MGIGPAAAQGAAWKKKKAEQDQARAAAAAQGASTDSPTAAETEGQTEDKAKPEKYEIPQRFEEQCFLIDAVELFSSANKKTRYKNFLIIDDDTDDAAKLVSKINSRFERPEGAGLKSFLSITPAQRSMLIPKIRLFVQKFRNEQDKVGIVQELQFTDWTRKSSVEDIMKNAQGRGDAAGLVSFSYTYDGRDPGSTENMIKAQVRMLFTDFESISRPIRPATAVEKKHMGAVNSTRSGVDYLPPKFLDLILRQPTRKNVPGKTLPFLTKIHAEIGWQTPESSIDNEDLLPTKLKNYIRDGFLNEYFVLTMTEHDLDFKEDGRVELSIDFRAAIENALFASTDILELKNEKELKEKMKQNVNKLMARRNKIEGLQTKYQDLETRRQKNEADAPTDFAEDFGFLAGKAGSGGYAGGASYSTVADELKVLEKQVKRIDEDIRFAKERLKTKKYKIFMEELEATNKIKFFDLNSTSVKKWQNQLSLSIAAGQENKERYTAAQALKENKVFLSGTGSTVKTVPAGRSDIQDEAFNAAKKAVNKKANDNLDRHADVLSGKDVEKSKTSASLEYDKNKADSTLSPEIFRIHFMYLGDILDVAARTLYSMDGHTGILRIVSGPVQYIAKDGSLKSINLADVPISLEAFSNWLYNNIISKGVMEYSLGTFLNSMTTELVFEAFGMEKCNAGAIGPSMIMTPIVLNLEGTGRKNAKLKEPIARKGGKYPRKNVTNFAKEVRNNVMSRGSAVGSQRVNSGTYVFICGLVREENNFNYGVNIGASLKDGIVRFGIGRDRGIVNTIKFQKVQSKYQAEMRVEQRETSRSSVLGEFRQVYNATVKMIGNTLFKVGQYVYIDPTTMGIDSRTALTLGLGGYFVINKVEGEISRDGYTTVLDCRYNSEGSPQSIRRKRRERASKRRKHGVKPKSIEEK